MSLPCQSSIKYLVGCTAPKCFVRPDELIPERWTTKPDLIINKKGYMLFNVGTCSFVGRQLALMEVRTVIVKLLYELDIAFASGENGGLIMKTKDYFVWGDR